MYLPAYLRGLKSNEPVSYHPFQFMFLPGLLALEGEASLATTLGGSFRPSTAIFGCSWRSSTRCLSARKFPIYNCEWPSHSVWRQQRTPESRETPDCHSTRLIAGHDAAVIGRTTRGTVRECSTKSPRGCPWRAVSPSSQTSSSHSRGACVRDMQQA